MKPYYEDEWVKLYHGDCLDVLRTLPDASVDSVVTDPPYGLEFMGKEWDRFGGDTRQPFRGELQTPDNPYGRATVRYAGASSYGGRSGAMQSFQAWCELWATECLRVLKPGGHLLAFGGTRTSHRLACAIEDAGFEIRDSIAWLYGSGFPKSLDVSKAIDKSAGAERGAGTPGPYSARRPREEVAATNAYADGVGDYGSSLITTPATPEAERWQGWGTALKPAHEPVVVARKPLVGTVAANVLTHGTGALNIDDCRIGDDTSRADRYNGKAAHGQSDGYRMHGRTEPFTAKAGRWPANVVLDEHQAAALDEQSGELASTRLRAGEPGRFGWRRPDHDTGETRPLACPDCGHADAAHRFYSECNGTAQQPDCICTRTPDQFALDLLPTPNAGNFNAGEDPEQWEARRGSAGPNGHTRNQPERDQGIYGGGRGLWTEGGPAGDLYGDTGGASRFFYTAKAGSDERPTHGGTSHPTVKPLALMRWLVRLVTPPGGTVLEPFAGSGTTAEACLLERFHCIAIEREDDYLPLILQRIHRRRDPIAYLTNAGHDLGLFGEAS